MKQSRTFDQLFLEPDIRAKIFSYVSENDLHHVELVCKEWRKIVIENRLWGRKLELKYNSDPVWKTLLIQNNWSPNVKLKHDQYKSLFKEMKILSGPEELTESFLSSITNNFDLIKSIPVGGFPLLLDFSKKAEKGFHLVKIALY